MRKMAGIFLAVGLVFVVAGCTTPEHNVWLKRGVGVKMEQAVKDLKSCAMKEEFIFDANAKGGPAVTSSASSYAQSNFDKCMMAKGFKKKMMK
ncbi:MAG: hypothetical protein OXL41_09090 [Nitrospinae bacterium]|nr:hypothetical protein [Nitrospinota bacterium]